MIAVWSRVRSVPFFALCAGFVVACAEPTAGPSKPARTIGESQVVSAPSDDATIQVGAGWTGHTPLPAATSHFVAASVGGIVYVFGGANATNTPTRTTRSYNTTTGIWTTLAQMPAARADQDGAVAVGNIIYVFGGRNPTGTYTPSLFAYNTTSNTWTSLAAMPLVGGCGGAVAIGNSIYVGNGCNTTGQPAEDFFRYDIATNQWTTLASPNDFKQYSTMFALGGKIYWIGGATFAAIESNAESFDPAQGFWTIRNFLPRAVEGLSVGVVRNVPVFTGGTNGSANYTETSYYDAAVDTWRPTLPLPSARSFAASTVVNNSEFYVIGGADAAGAPVANVDSYHLGDAWVTMAPMPTPRGYHAGAILNQLTYAVGGRLAGAPSSLTVNEVYNLVTNTWTTKAPLPAGRWAAAGAAANGKLYVIGGFSGGTTASPQTTVFQYTPSTNTWTTRAPLPVAIGFPIATSVGGKIYVNDGGDGVNMFGKVWYAYTPSTNSWALINQSPDGFGEGAVTTVGTQVAATGGYGPGFSLQNNFETYDPATDNWSFGPQVPLALFGLVSEAIGTHLYITGGSNALGNKNAALMHFDYANPAPWDFLTPMPTARSHAISTKLGGYVMVIGGWDDISTGTGVVELYVP